VPRYTYRCAVCESVTEVVHSMKECLTECEKCEEEATLVRIPALTYVKLKAARDQNVHSTAPVGTLVEEHIREAREELTKDKAALRTKDYKEKK
jgi:putative FmdB family regulatory protein